MFHKKDLSQYHFLITGGAGFIGSHVVEYLLNHNAGKVRVLDNLSTGFQSNIDLFSQHPNYEFVFGDIRDYETCQKACEDMHFISHQAAIGSVPRSIANPMYTTNVNVAGFVNMCQAAKEAGIQRVVYASSSSVYGDETTLPKVEHKTGKLLSPYAASKMSNELYADVFGALHNMEMIGFRYFNVFGPRQSPKGQYAAVIPLFIEGLLRQTPVYINGDGLQTRDFTFVDNAVQANILAFFCENQAAYNEAYNIAVGDKISVLSLFQSIANELNSSQEAIHRAPRMGDIRDSMADISKANQLLAYDPTINYEEGLKQTIAYFKSLDDQPCPLKSL